MSNRISDKMAKAFERFNADQETFRKETEEDNTNDKIMGEEISYEGYQVHVREDEENWYIDFQTGLGEGIYPKDSFSLEQALKDQMNIYNENPDD